MLGHGYTLHRSKGARAPITVGTGTLRKAPRPSKTRLAIEALKNGLKGLLELEEGKEVGEGGGDGMGSNELTLCPCLAGVGRSALVPLRGGE
jgi:hypothetical protein